MPPTPSPSFPLAVPSFPSFSASTLLSVRSSSLSGDDATPLTVKSLPIFCGDEVPKGLDDDIDVPSSSAARSIRLRFVIALPLSRDDDLVWKCSGRVDAGFRKADDSHALYSIIDVLITEVDFIVLQSVL
mmetsp:Transcript_2956/g.3542  ORF Transcript_2956/g.3542 Transcript_2956/m.3542 type:complete len:130 (-) Transcript_2956:26-415(-)